MSNKKKPPHFDLFGDCEDDWESITRDCNSVVGSLDGAPPIQRARERRFCADCGAPWLMNLDGSTKAAMCTECGFVISCTLEPKTCTQCRGRMGGFREELCNRCQPRPPADPDDVIETTGEEVSRRKAT